MWLCEDGQCHQLLQQEEEEEGEDEEGSGGGDASLQLASEAYEGNFQESVQQQEELQREGQQHLHPHQHQQEVFNPSVKNNYDPREYVWNPLKNMYTRFTRTYLDFYYREPLVEFNPFIQKDHSSPHQHETMASVRSLHMKPPSYHIPTFEEARRTLPSPVWKGHEDAVACYYKAWQLVH